MALTESQSRAVAVRGNAIVVAGAGTGKTRTLVERCLDLLRKGASLDRILMVTFTDAAAIEMRHRLRLALEAEVAEGADEQRDRFAEQLALLETARISTLHGFCLRLVQAHFTELGLDPEVRVLDDAQCTILAADTLDGLMEACYAGDVEFGGAVQDLVRVYSPGRDQTVRDLVLSLHRHSQSLPDAGGWMQTQQDTWQAQEPAAWASWVIQAFVDWHREWLPILQAHAGVKNIDDCLVAMSSVPAPGTLPHVEQVTAAVAAAGADSWPHGTAIKVRDPLRKCFDEASFLASAASQDSLARDWQAVRGPVRALLALTAAFSERFANAKRAMGGLDFADLEQLTLKILRDAPGNPSPVAEEWRQRLEHVFVDEYQDINGAQDAILSAISRRGHAGNRFLVGDIKQSIYQFRLADPHIFRHYDRDWGSGTEGERISLTENFRSRPGILGFVNALFSALMRERFGGVPYEPLTPAGDSDAMDSGETGPCVELHLVDRRSAGRRGAPVDGETELEDLTAAQQEARLVAQRLRDLRESGFVIRDPTDGQLRPVEWRDMAILMRSPAPRTEAYAKVFHQAGLPLSAERGGFLDAIEVSDLVSLLRLLDNPLQDIPLLAVLRSPLVGLRLDDLAIIRAESSARPFWRALTEFASRSDRPADGHVARELVATFLSRFARWRDSVRQLGPALCLEQVLSETRYDLLLGANPRGAQQLANVRQLLDLARQFDPYLRQGLYRFLNFLKSLESVEETLEPAPAPAGGAVRLMSIHRSKGLEFPVVVVSGLGTRFNLRELGGLILVDSDYGLAPQAMTADGAGRYPTVPFWLASRHRRRQRLGEELRLLYVATTRARDRLICTGTLSRRDHGRWMADPGRLVSDHELLNASSPVDWLMAWLPSVTSDPQWTTDDRGASDLMAWQLWDPTDERLTLTTVDSEAPVPDDRLDAVDPTAVEAVRERLNWSYGHPAATRESAKASVSALRSRAEQWVDEDAVQSFEFNAPGARRIRGPGSSAASARLSAAERGTVHHRFLQHVGIAEAGTVDFLAAEADRMVTEGLLSEREAKALDLDRMAAFWNSDPGNAIRERAPAVRRELAFTARFDAVELHAVLGLAVEASLSDEFVVVQGRIDLAVILEDGIWVLDYKTDDVRGAALERRAREYTSQMKLYAAALERIHGRPVRRRWLHFLATGQTVGID